MTEHEIGSIYELDRNSYGNDDGLDTGLFSDCFQNGYADFCTVSCGRDALIMAMQECERQYSGQIICMVPLYLCDSIDSCMAYYGWKLVYYPIGRDFTPDVESFISLYRQYTPQVVFIHGYYGVNTALPLEPFLKECQAAGVSVIEDLTQYIGAPRSYLPDYYVASLRKWAAMPDGGIIIAKRALSYKPRSVRTDFVKEKWIALTQKQDYLTELNETNYALLQADKKLFLERNRAAEGLLDENHTVYRMSPVSVHIWNTTDITEQLSRRAQNARTLAQQIESPLAYDGTASPLYFPFFVKNRAAVQAALQAKDIYAPVLWPISPLIKTLTKDVAYIYDTLLALPCDFRYGQKDMERICRVLSTEISSPH